MPLITDQSARIRRAFCRTLTSACVFTAVSSSSLSGVFAEDTALRPAASIPPRATAPLRRTDAALQKAAFQSAQQGGNDNAVLQELNKLFRKNGQQMPPMDQHKLPYATTPQLERVRPKAEEPAAPEKKPNLLNRIFGRFRRKPAEPESSATPTPPPIIMPEGNVTRQPFVPAPANAGVQSPPARLPQNTTLPQVRQIVRPTTSDAGGTPSQTISQPRPMTVSPAETPQPRPAVKTPTADGFESPFSEASAAEGGLLDLDSLIEADEQPVAAPKPQMQQGDGLPSLPTLPATTAEVPGIAAPAEPIAIEDESNPFETATEVPLPEVDADSAEMEDPFTGITLEEEAPLQDAENPFAEQIALPPVSDHIDNEDLDLSISAPDASASPEMKGQPAEEGIPADSLPRISFGETAVPEETEGWSARESSENRTAREEPAAPRQPAEPPAATVERTRQQDAQSQRERQMQLIKERAHLAGFKGFCPVELRDHRDLVDASEAYQAVFGLRTYTFSSARALATFEAEPSRYAPAAGGYDIVVLVNSGEEREGSLDFAAWYRDRLYLFRSRETMAAFQVDPQKYANQY